MFGQLSHELEVNVPASEAWELYGTMKLVNLVEKELSIVDKIERVEGDRGVGTVVKLVFNPGMLISLRLQTGSPGFSAYKERFTKIDNATHTREAEVVEGGYLDSGFTLYRVRLEIIERTIDSCTIKSTIEYQVTEEAAANASSMVSIGPLANTAEIARTYLTKRNA